MEDNTAPIAGPENTLTWLAEMPAQVAGMPVHVKLNFVSDDELVEFTEKL